MTKFKFLVCFIFALQFGSVNLCFSQNYFHSPNDTLIATTLLDQQVTMNITQIHPNNDTLHFFWTKVLDNLPFGWEATICDNSQCYTSLENSGVTLPVLPGDDGLMLVHCTPHITEGIGTIRYAIYEENTPLIVDTLTWIIEATSLGITITNTEKPMLWVANSNLHLNTAAQKCESFLLLDQFGKIQMDENIVGQKSFFLPELKPAIYYIQLRNSTSTIFQKIKI